MNKKFFRGKTALIMGLGRFGGGLDAAKFAVQAGAKTIVTDLATAEKLAEAIKKLKEFPAIEFHLGRHDAADFERADIIIVNPAVLPDNEFVGVARRAKRLVTSQIEIFLANCPGVTIGITGSNGKSTTTALTAHLLRAGLGRQGFNHSRVWLGGNIGNEPLLTIIDRIEPDHLVVLELSSFQIEQLAQSRRMPRVALITNLMANHLDRYGTFEAYFSVKEKLFRLQKLDAKNPAVSIFNGDDPITREWSEKYDNQPGRMCLTFSADNVGEDLKQKFSLPGRANLCNLAAALAVAKHFGIEHERIKELLPQFRPLPHRLELVGEVNGARWYNDSKATTPDSTIAALKAFEAPEIIIAGGYDKHIPFDKLGIEIARRAKAAILIGETADKIARAIKAGPKSSVVVESAESLSQAVDRAADLAAAGEVVLLSPACASYDMFDNFEQRGQMFTELVRQLPTCR